MKITIDIDRPTDVVATVGTKKVKYAELELGKQRSVCVALEAARLNCSMTLKAEKKEG